MRPALQHAETARADWREALLCGFELGLPQAFNFEMLIDRAERGDWSDP